MKRSILIACAALLMTAPAFAHGSNGNNGPQISGSVSAAGISGSFAGGAVFAGPGGTVDAPNGARFTIDGGASSNLGLNGTTVTINGSHSLDMQAVSQGSALAIGAGLSGNLDVIGGTIGGSINPWQ